MKGPQHESNTLKISVFIDDFGSFPKQPLIRGNNAQHFLITCYSTQNNIVFTYVYENGILNKNINHKFLLKLREEENEST